MFPKLNRVAHPSLSQTVSIQLTIVTLLALFWLTLGLGSAGIFVSGLRVGSTLLLLFFLPGLLLTQFARLRITRGGEAVLYAVGLSLVFLSLFVTSVGVLTPLLNVQDTFSLQPLAISLTVVLLLITALLHVVETPEARFDWVAPTRLTAGLIAVPVVAVLAAGFMNDGGDASLMFLFVVLVAAAVVVSPTRFLPPTQYPLAIFLIGLATFLHRNLLTGGVIGADVQFQYFLAQHIQETHVWSPGVGSRITALPMVTAVPAAISTLADVSVAAVFKVAYVFVFSLVPVGIYYVGRRIFGNREALLGSFFFIFYHISFSLTPGKQLLSELFVVLLLLLLFEHGLSTVGNKAVAVLLSIGVIHTHYGTAFVLGGSLLAGHLMLGVVRRVVDEFEHDSSVVYPVTFLGLAIAWYATFSPQLLNQILRMPLVIGQQVANLVVGTAVGTGANYIGGQVTVLDQLNVLVYLVLTALLGIGLLSRVVTHGVRLRRGERTEYVEYTALSIPMFVFLASTFFVIANLWADRTYQMVLVVLAPFVALGFRTLFAATVTALERLGKPRDLRPRWSLLAVLLSALFVLNSGAAYAAVGNADTATFDSNANDYVFTDDERAGAAWLKEHAGLTGSGSYRSPSAASPSDDTVTIYTDSVSYQLLRSTTPETYYDVRIERLRSPWHPEFDQSRLQRGYVFIRERSVRDVSGSERLPITSLSREHAEDVTEAGTVVFRNDEVTIVRIEGRSDGYSDDL